MKSYSCCSTYEARVYQYACICSIYVLKWLKDENLVRMDLMTTLVAVTMWASADETIILAFVPLLLTCFLTRPAQQGNRHVPRLTLTKTTKLPYYKITRFI